MRFPAVLRTLATLLLLLAAFLLIPTALALVYREPAALRAFLLTLLALTASGTAGLLLLVPKSSPDDFGVREGILLSALAWTAATAFGSLPFVLSRTIPSWTDAFFETMSGFTTTGASILTDIEVLPKSLLFWRSLTHWLGGMGIVVLTIAVLPALGSGGAQLVRAEMPGPSLERTSARIAQTAKVLWIIYLGLTLLQALLLWLFGLDWFDAFIHTFGTMATGGFSSRNASVGHFRSPAVELVITVFMILAGTNFVLHYRLLTGRLSSLLRDSEWKSYILVFAVSTLLAALSLRLSAGRTWADALRAASFQCGSILTTTGFVTEDYALWPPFAQAVLFLLMFVGGCSGSTGGGIKVVRLVALLKLAFNEINYRLHPRGVFSLKLDGEPVAKSFLYPVAAFVTLYITLLFGVTLWTASAGVDLFSAFSASLATLGNIGPGFGRVGPALNYAALPDRVKWVLSFAMMAGRLELFTVLVLFTRRYWEG